MTEEKLNSNQYKVYAVLTSEEQEEIKNFIDDTRSINGITILKSTVFGALLLVAVRDPLIKEKVRKHIGHRVSNG